MHKETTMTTHQAIPDADRAEIHSLITEGILQNLRDSRRLDSFDFYAERAVWFTLGALAVLLVQWALNS
jgi:hypothetical protein